MTNSYSKGTFRGRIGVNNNKWIFKDDAPFLEFQTSYTKRAASSSLELMKLATSLTLSVRVNQRHCNIISMVYISMGWIHCAVLPIVRGNFSRCLLSTLTA